MTTESEIYLDQLQSLHKAMIAVGAVPEWCPLSGMEEHLLVYVAEQKALVEARDTTIAALRDEVERLRALSVENIMLDVVPGFDGQGEEVFAKSVEEVEALLTQLSQEAEDAQLSAQQVKYELVESAVFEDGGVTLIRRGTEDERCARRGGRRLYVLAAPAEGSDKQ